MMKTLFLLSSCVILSLNPVNASEEYASHENHKSKTMSSKSSINYKDFIEFEIKEYDQLLSKEKNSSHHDKQVINYYESYKHDLEELLNNIEKKDDIKEKLYQIYKKHNPHTGRFY